MTVGPTESLTPNATPVKVSLQPPLPDLLINLSASFSPHLDCVPNGSGQVWHLLYPYTAKEILLADADASYFYPVWSPDGKWIAYVQSKAGTQIKSSDQFGSHLEGEESIWVMRPDGSEKRKLAQVARIDYDSTNGCLIVQAINRPLHWSPDGKYIAFVHNNPEESLSYLVEVETGQIHKLSSNAPMPPEWSPVGDQLVMIEGGIILVDSKNFTRTPIPFPADVPDSFEITRVAWDSGGQSLLALGHDQAIAPVEEAVVSLWRIEIKTTTWEQLAELGALGKSQLVSLGGGQAWAVQCQNEGLAPDHLVLLDTRRWQPLGAINGPEPFCETVQLFKDKSGAESIGFVDTESLSRNIWAVKADAGELFAQQIVEDESLNIPLDLYIIDFSPKP
jgi:hypothetical protein